PYRIRRAAPRGRRYECQVGAWRSLRVSNFGSDPTSQQRDGHPSRRRKRVMRVTKWSIVGGKALPQWVAGPPRRATRVERVEFRPDHARHVGLHGLPVLGLQVGEVAIALREAGEQRRVEPHARGWVYRIDAVALVDRLAQHDAPAVVALLEEVVEAPAAHPVAHGALDLAALGNRHLCLAGPARAPAGATL